MSNSRALRDEIYAMLAFNGTGNKDEVNIFSKNLVFNTDSACRALNEDGISAAWSEFGAALAFHRATYSAHAKMIGSDGDYLTYYVYGFVGDKYKFRESDTGYQSTASILNFIGVYWQQIGAIRPIDIYVEFQMTMTVPR